MSTHDELVALGDIVVYEGDWVSQESCVVYVDTETIWIREVSGNAESGYYFVDNDMDDDVITGADRNHLRIVAKRDAYVGEVRG